MVAEPGGAGSGSDLPEKKDPDMDSEKPDPTRGKESGSDLISTAGAGPISVGSATSSGYHDFVA